MHVSISLASLRFQFPCYVQYNLLLTLLLLNASINHFIYLFEHIPSKLLELVESGHSQVHVLPLGNLEYYRLDVDCELGQVRFLTRMVECLQYHKCHH